MFMTDEVVQKKEWTLTIQDRCDKCSAQAYVKVTGVSGELLFCSHDYNDIVNDPAGYKKIMEFMYEVTDEREKLVENKAVGSAN